MGDAAATDPEAVYAAYSRGLRDAAAMLDVDRQTLRLHAGELSAQEMRAVLAVSGWKRREMLARVSLERLDVAP